MKYLSKISKALLGGLVLFGVFALAGYADAQSDGPVTISTSAYKHSTLWPSNQRKMASDSAGNLYVIYTKLYNNKYRLFVAKSIDDGRTW